MSKSQLRRLSIQRGEEFADQKRVMQTQQEQRQDSLEESPKCFILNEGVCPTCWHDAEITSIGGKHDFMMGWEHLENIERNWWAEDPRWDSRVVGGMTFKCSNGHEHYIEQYVDGDWSS